jgi:putative hemolysin
MRSCSRGFRSGSEPDWEGRDPPAPAPPLPPSHLRDIPPPSSLDTTAPTSPDRLLPGQALIPPLDEVKGKYRVRFARTEADLDTVRRLRFRVFNLELNEGLTQSYRTGRDGDAFDAQCQHVMVERVADGECIGTYRLQVAESALNGIGFYTAGEFQLGALPDSVLLNSVELGRACIERSDRNKRALYLLWRGLIDYVTFNGKDRFFGCSSITSQDPAEGLRLYRQLQDMGHVHPTYLLEPAAGYACETAHLGSGEVEIPTLFGIYLRHGAWILGPPAIDRQFGTIDYVTYVEVTADHIRAFGQRPAR